MWKLLFTNVAGAAHGREGQPCQDSCRVRLKAQHARSLLLAACADGAGSAPHSDDGARLACRTLVAMAAAELADGAGAAQVDRAAALSWFRATRQTLVDAAQQRGVTVRDLACTLLLAIVGDEAAAFCQLGDGVIVCGQDGGYVPVFSPGAGEYANTTWFLSDVDFEDHFDFACWPGRVDEIALLTDGLQRLALEHDLRTAHVPFFRPLFATLRDPAHAGKLRLALRSFLDSPAINGRTDDDKTLVLAVRMPSRVDPTRAC
jgi:hypothetical protein